MAYSESEAKIGLPRDQQKHAEAVFKQSSSWN
jgi:hypothetical protein